MKICIQGLTDNLKDRQEKTRMRKWGDHWFKRDVQNAFSECGHTVLPRTKGAQASLLLQGKFWTSKAPVKAVWVCGNVASIATEIYQDYFDVVYTLSDKYSNILRSKGVECSTLLPATKAVYEPLYEPTKQVIYMGALKEVTSWDRYNLIKALGKAWIKIDVLGEGWKRYKRTLSPTVQEIGTYHPHKSYRDLFSKYKIAVYKHAEDMCPWNFVALRVLDMMATGNCLVISDYNEGITAMFGDLVPMYRTPSELVKLVQYFLKHEKERVRRWTEIRRIIKENHLFKYRVQAMLNVMLRLRDEKKNRIS